MGFENLTLNGIDLLLTGVENGVNTRICLLLLAIYRYRPNQAYFRLFKNASETTTDYAFDLLLSDGAKKLKVVSNPSLRYRITSGQISSKSIICVKEFYTSDSVLTGEFVVVSEIEDLGSFDGTFDDIPFVSEKHSSFKPMLGSRGAYLHWNDDGCLNLDDERWTRSYIVNYKESIPVDFPSITKTIAFTRNININLLDNKGFNVSLIGRVITKSSLLFYGSNQDNIRMYPYKFQFLFKDGSTRVTCVVWNDSALRYFNFINVGDLLILRNYKVKKHSETVEISLNSNVIIQKVTSGSLNQWKPEEFKTRFGYDRLTFSTLETAARGEIEQEFLVIGRLVYLSEVRIVVEEGYRLCRIARILDSSVKRAVFIKLYVCSDEEALNDLKVGDILKTRLVLKRKYPDLEDLLLFETSIYAKLSVWPDDYYKSYVKQLLKDGASEIPSLEDCSLIKGGTCFMPLYTVEKFEDLRPFYGEGIQLSSFESLNLTCQSIILNSEIVIFLECYIDSISQKPKKNAEMNPAIDSMSLDYDEFYHREPDGVFKAIETRKYGHILTLCDFDTPTYLEALFIPNAATFDRDVDRWYYNSLKQTFSDEKMNTKSSVTAETKKVGLIRWE